MRSNYYASRWIHLSLLAVGALVVRLYGLDDYYYSSDDAWHLVVANQESFSNLLHAVLKEEVHPPLSYILWYGMLHVSDNELWLRSSSIIPSLLLIPSSYLLGKRYLDEKAGYILALIAAFGHLSITVGVTIRAYSLLLLCLCWALIYLHDYINQRRSSQLIAYAMLCLLAIGLHHSATFIIATMGLMLFAHLVYTKQWKLLCYAVVIHACFAGLSLGYIYLLYHSYDFEGGSPFYYWHSKHWASFALHVLSVLAQSICFTLGEYSNLLFTASFALPFIFIALAIGKKQWSLLFIILTPLIFLFIADYLRLYPAPNIPRNLYPFYFSFALLITYGLSFILSFMSAYMTRHIHIYGSLLVVGLTITLALPPSFRYSSYEFHNTKEDFNRSIDRLTSSQDQLLVTQHETIWYLSLLEPDHHITRLTPNISLFSSESFQVVFYSKKHARSGGNVIDTLDDFRHLLHDTYQLFPEHTNIVFFHIGGSGIAMEQMLYYHIPSLVYDVYSDIYDEMIAQGIAMITHPEVSLDVYTPTHYPKYPHVFITFPRHVIKELFLDKTFLPQHQLHTEWIHSFD